jgi:hypothetical protein
MNSLKIRVNWWEDSEDGMLPHSFVFEVKDPKRLKKVQDLLPSKPKSANNIITTWARALAEYRNPVMEISNLEATIIY